MSNQKEPRNSRRGHESLSPQMKRERVAAQAARFKRQFGDHIYLRAFAPVLAEELELINMQEKAESYGQHW